MPPENDYVMTGKITLTGKVIQVCGLEIKLRAEIMIQAKYIILPKAMEHDWNQIKEEERGGIKAYFVEYYIEIFKMLFPRYRLPDFNGASDLATN
uniref:Lon proteolytic domain-containing protein n=3 Tax=Meloidogyne TaxID=189290 RepID=A0A914M603_MELIC